MNFAEMMDMLKNPQALQARAEDFKRRTETIEAAGSSGGGMVKIRLNGALSMLSCEIAPELLDPAELGMLQDLIVAAYNDASARVRETLQRELSEGGLGLPPGILGGAS